MNCLKGFDISHELHHALPKRLGAGLSVALAAEEAAETGHETDHLAEGGRCPWRRLAFGHQPGGAPFLGGKGDLARQVGTISAEGHQEQNPPNDDQIDRQGPLQPFHGGELQGFHPTAALEDAEENCHQPPPPIPADAEHRLVQAGDRLVGEEQPFDGLLADRWRLLAGQDHRGLAGFPFVAGLPHRLDDRPGRAPRRRQHGEFHLAQNTLALHPGAQFPTFRQNPVMIGPNQIVRRMAQLRRPVEQFPKVAFPIRDIDQAGVRQTLREFGDPLVAFRPTPTFLDIDLALGFARLHPGVQHTQRHPALAHRQRRVQVHSVLPLVAQPPQPRDARLAGEVQFGGVLEAQHPRLPAHRGLAVRRQQRPPLHRLVVQQPVRAALVSANPPQATGMLCVGWADRSSTSRISCFVNRGSPSAAPENSSIAQAIGSQIQKLILSGNLW